MVPGEGSGETIPEAGAPDLMADEHERRKRDLLRAALFGGDAEPEAIGRFRLLGRLGAGGMGVVYAARDEQLGRDVAVKLLRSRGGGATERDRLLREAQAMAKLSHPNVVTVYEVGFHGDRLFVAMEMVRGQTVAAWLREQKRGVREVIEVLSRAGQGLAAAHAAGLVHRDFKPENVMLGEGGAVKVLDFGLARQAPEPGSDAEPPGDAESCADGAASRPQEMPASGAPGESSSRASALDRRLTETGTILGTPAYMAPEQFAGEATDARTDQYAFCVSLYEALYGERPFEGGTIAEIAKAALEGTIREAPPGSEVPVWLRRVVLRGLAKVPADRWPSMEALLAELSKDPAAVRRRQLRWGALALIATGTLAATAWLSRGAPIQCEGGRAEIELVWGAEARAAVRSGLARAGDPYAADAAERAIRALDRHAGGWAAMHREACLSNARGEQSSELLDLRMACLDRRRAEVRALAAVLAEGAPGTAARAVTAAESLSSLQACADAEALRAQVKPPSDPGVVAAVEAVRAALAEVEADDRAGQYTRELSRAQAALAGAEKTGYRPVIAEAAYDQGVAHISLSDYESAVKAMDRAYFEALATGHDQIAAHASRQLFTVLGYYQSKREAGAPWARSAEALALRLSGSPVLLADFMNTRALVRAEAGELDASAADYTEALAVYERELGASHLKVAMLLSNMAQVAYLRGRHDESAKQLERAAAIREAALGPDHPDVGDTLTNLALVRISQGKPQVAVDLLLRALAIRERVHGKDSPRSTFILNNLADAYSSMGRDEDALSTYRKSLSILEADKSASRVRVAMTRHNIGIVLTQLGRHDEALVLLESALATRREVLPKDHASTAGTLLALARARLGKGQVEDGLALTRDALAMYDRVKDTDPAEVATGWTTLGQALLAKKDPVAAKDALTRALSLRPPEGGERSARAETRFWLAKALIAAARPEDRARATTLVSQAIGDYRAAGDGFGKRIAEIEAWASGLGIAIPPR